MTDAIHIEKDLYIEAIDNKMILSQEKIITFNNMGKVLIPLISPQRPQDMCMIAIKIIGECNKINPDCKSFAIDYIYKYIGDTNVI